YPTPASSQVSASSLTMRVPPDVAIHAFFTTAALADSRFAKYIILDEDTLKQKPYGVAGRKQRAFQNRDIIRLFEGLKVSESFLLKTNVREFLFRKPATTLAIG